MKYRQLTKEQLENLNEEFARFLASQGVDKNEWEQIKADKPQLAQDEINVFSDVVWDDVLTKTSYIEHFSSNTVNLFKCEKDTISRIVIKVAKHVDLNTAKDYQWLLSNPKDSSIEYFEGTKKYGGERNVELFDLIEKGGHISKGELYGFFARIICK